MTRFTDAEKAECAAREVKFRQRVYARRVTEGKMKQEQATREIGLMQAIADDYKARTELPL